MKRLQVTPERISAMRKRILRVLEKNPNESYWEHDLYFRFRTDKNLYVVYVALESVRNSSLVKVKYFRRGKQIMHGIRALSLKK